MLRDPSFGGFKYPLVKLHHFCDTLTFTNANLRSTNFTQGDLKDKKVGPYACSYLPIERSTEHSLTLVVYTITFAINKHILFSSGLAEPLPEEGATVQPSLAPIKSVRPSLAKIVLTLEGNAAKQQALAHMLAALHIMYARYENDYINSVNYSILFKNISHSYKCYCDILGMSTVRCFIDYVNSPHSVLL